MAVLTGAAWKHHKSLVAESGMTDVGIGDDLTKRLGVERQAVADLFYEYASVVPDGGCLCFNVNDFRVYMFRRSCCFDVGTRVDFEEMGWSDIIDLAEKNYA